MPVVDVDLDAPPADRWAALRPHAPKVKALAEHYVAETGGAEFAAFVAPQVDERLTAEQRAEIRGLASVCDVAPAALLVANAYYDLVKHALMCTAWAVDEGDTTMHARNLDWFAPRQLLAKTTQVVRYRRAGRVVWESVGWPGFVGTLTGVAPGRFAVSLNAVVSGDAPGVAPPVGLVLRALLEDEMVGFDDAVSRLNEIPLGCDALLLVTGPERGQRVVIERAPARAARRGPRAGDGALAVTNGYRALDGNLSVGGGGALQDTSCSRYDRALRRIRAERPSTPEQAFDILNDKDVRMDITVQQVVMSAREGLLGVRSPGLDDATP